MSSERQPPINSTQVIFRMALIAAVCLVMWYLVAPKLKRSRLAARETGAIGLIQTIAIEQTRLRELTYFDQDGDSLAEYAGLLELECFKSAAADKVTLADGGVALLCDGYLFRVEFPPQAAGESVVDARERGWVAYAWPETLGITGHRALAIAFNGYVCSRAHSPVQHAFSTANFNAQNYSGAERPPAGNAAFVMPQGVHDWSKGEMVPGDNQATDGCAWLTPGC